MIQLVEVKPEMMKGVKPEIELPEGVWLAGGCVRRWFTGEPQDSDFDIFTSSEEVRVKAIKKLFGDKKPIYDTSSAVEFRIDKQRIQFIKRYFPTVAETLDKFDFHVSQFAFDGTTIFATPEALVNACRKRLSVHEVQPGFEVDTLRRAFKYAKAGYWPCGGTIAALAAAVGRVSDEERMIQQERVMSPGAGGRWD